MQAEPPKAEPPKRKRRWFQFSLRTLLIVVTLFCVIVGGYVGWQKRIVNERKAYLEANKHVWENGLHVVFTKGDPNKAPSLIRFWLGDHAQENVFVDENASKDIKQSVAALFPEATILDW